jgi:hypothetical protein
MTKQQPKGIRVTNGGESAQKDYKAIRRGLKKATTMTNKEIDELIQAMKIIDVN